jgi:centrosomal protein CEP41
LIIIYSKDERSGIPYATLLIQKGFENIYFLSGGIEDFVTKHPEWCDGTGVQHLINEKKQQELLNREGINILIHHSKFKSFKK